MLLSSFIVLLLLSLLLILYVVVVVVVVVPVVNRYHHKETLTFDFVGLGALVGQRHGHLPVCHRVNGVRSEGEFGFEDGLPLQTGALPDEKMVEITRDRVLVNVEDLLTQMEGHGTVGPSVGGRNKGRVMRGLVYAYGEDGRYAATGKLFASQAEPAEQKTKEEEKMQKKKKKTKKRKNKKRKNKKRKKKKRKKRRKKNKKRKKKKRKKKRK